MKRRAPGLAALALATLVLVATAGARAEEPPMFAFDVTSGALPPLAQRLPDDPLVCERIAEVLLQRHKAREALSLLRNLHQRFPQYPQIPRAYLLAARGFAEGLGQLEPAGKLLAFIRQRYPDTPLLAEVASLEQVLEKMARQGG